MFGLASLDTLLTYNTWLRKSPYYELLFASDADFWLFALPGPLWKILGWRDIFHYQIYGFFPDVKRTDRKAWTLFISGECYISRMITSLSLFYFYWSTRLTRIIVFAHVVRPSVRPSPLFKSRKTKQQKTVFTTVVTMGLAEWIIDDTCLVSFVMDHIHLQWMVKNV